MRGIFDFVVFYMMSSLPCLVSSTGARAYPINRFHLFVRKFPILGRNPTRVMSIPRCSGKEFSGSAFFACAGPVGRLPRVDWVGSHSRERAGSCVFAPGVVEGLSK